MKSDEEERKIHKTNSLSLSLELFPLRPPASHSPSLSTLLRSRTRRLLKHRRRAKTMEDHHEQQQEQQETLAAFSFPLLADVELFQSLEALGARPAELSLDRPTADAMRPVYELLVSGLTDVSR